MTIGTSSTAGCYVWYSKNNLNEFNFMFCHRLSLKGALTVTTLIHDTCVMIGTLFHLEELVQGCYLVVARPGFEPVNVE